MDDKETRIVKANHLLNAKVGGGAIDEKKIRKSQKLMDNMAVDFLAMAERYLIELESALDDARAPVETDKDMAKKIQAMTEPVMEIKANASMFGYPLIGTLANVMLNFLETLDRIDDDVIAIVGAHHRTIKMLVLTDTQGDGGDFGRKLQVELKDACRRYFAKVASSRINNTEAPADGE